MMRRSAIVSFLAAAMLLTASFAGAATLKGVEFPDDVTIDGTPCRLNGAGVRKKFVISVYLGALYLATPTPDAHAAIAAEEPKRIVMHFVHSKVGAEKIVAAWREGFADNAAAELPRLRDRLDRFCGWFDADMHEGERIVLTYLPGRGTEVEVRGAVRGVVPGDDFMRALWSVWLGGKPADEGLKRGMLAAQR